MLALACERPTHKVTGKDTFDKTTSVFALADQELQRYLHKSSIEESAGDEISSKPSGEEVLDQVHLKVFLKQSYHVLFFILLFYYLIFYCFIYFYFYIFSLTDRLLYNHAEGRDQKGMTSIANYLHVQV